MKNYLSCRSSTVRALLTLVLFMAGECLVGKAASFRPEAENSASQKTLTFADRVAYQRAIEEVYWQHRIWPNENPRPKPSLDEVMSQQQIQQKVQVYLHNSQLLADQWQRPITPEQLQAEMERMVSHTRQPEVLRELFAALGNDPFIVAECLARPTLSERLVSELWLESNPVAETQSLRSSILRTEKESSVATDQPASGYYLPQIANSQVEDPAAGFVDHWTATSMTGAPDKRAYHTAVWTGAEMIVWGGVGPGLDYKNTGGRYSPSTDSWVATTTREAPAARSEHTAVWTGSEMIVWGGVGVGGLTLKSGGRYNPMTDSWIGTRSPSRSRERFRHTAVWTGTEMIIWGGSNGSLANYLKNGARYNPSTDTWVGLPKPPNRVAGWLHTAVWTGSEMIIWGGYNFGDLNTGGRYNPSTNSWVPTSLTGAPDARGDHRAIWTGSEMIVWGGSGALNTGGRYNPTTDSWSATTTIGAPHGRAQHTAVWTGTEMIIWGGSYLKTGGRYNPIADNWVATTTTDAPAGRQSHTAVWTGSEMIVWGGARPEFINTGGRYSP